MELGLFLNILGLRLKQLLHIVLAAISRPPRQCPKCWTSYLPHMLTSALCMYVNMYDAHAVIGISDLRNHFLHQP